MLRHLAHSLGKLGEDVEPLAKFYNVLPSGQFVLDAAALPIAWAQLQRATVIVIDDVPAQPAAASAFFAYLDVLARVARCQSPRPPPSSTAISTADGEGAAYKKWRTSLGGASDEAPEQLSFGGLQLLATQNCAPEAKSELRTEHPPPVPRDTHRELLPFPGGATSYGPGGATSYSPGGATSYGGLSSPGGISSPGGATTVKAGVLIHSALTAPSPHETIKVIVFH
jgi:hypothetical protein